MSISDIVQLATNEIISNTEDLTDTISIMVNGVKTILTREDYKTLKSHNDKVKEKMKADITVITTEL